MHNNLITSFKIECYVSENNEGQNKIISRMLFLRSTHRRIFDIIYAAEKFNQMRTMFVHIIHMFTDQRIVCNVSEFSR